MKRVMMMIAAGLLLSTTLINAQTSGEGPATGLQLKEGESAIVYYMPRTEVVIDVEYEEETQERGIFYQYSERYLAAKDVVTEDAVRYRFKSATIYTRTKADKSRAYVIPANQKMLQHCSVRLNNKGLIEGINLPIAHLAKSNDNTQKQFSQKETQKRTACEVMPLLEEQMMSGSISKMAEGTAKQIYSIRENRLNLLAGESEHTPADGEAMRLVLQEMKKQETALTRLFTGTKSIKTLHKEIAVSLESDMTNEVLFRFSKLTGVVDADDMSGEPYIINLTMHRQEYAPLADGEKMQAGSPIYQNIAGSADIRLTDGEKTIAMRSVPVAQAGVAVPLAADLFQKQDTRVVFDTRTGSVKEIIIPKSK